MNIVLEMFVCSLINLKKILKNLKLQFVSKLKLPICRRPVAVSTLYSSRQVNLTDTKGRALVFIFGIRSDPYTNQLKPTAITISTKYSKNEDAMTSVRIVHPHSNVRILYSTFLTSKGSQIINNTFCTTFIDVELFQSNLDTNFAASRLHRN